MSAQALWRCPLYDEDDAPALLSEAWCARVAKVRISDRMTHTEEERMHAVRLGAEAMRAEILADPSYYGLQKETYGLQKGTFDGEDA